MKTKNIFFIVSALVISGFITSCEKPKSTHSSHKNEQAITINIVAEPQALDPRKARSLGDINLVKAFNDGLTRSNKEGETTLALAEEIKKSSDGKTYTIKLKNATWSNGDPITSKDFEYAWKEALSPNFPSDNAYQLFVIRNAKAIKEGLLPANLLGFSILDDHTFTVSLEKPIPYFDKLLSLPIFFPVNEKVAAKDQTWAKNATNYVCSGPFVLVDWKHHDKIIAKKNKKYWDKDQVQLKQINMIMVSEDTELSLFEKEEINWVGSPFSSIPVDAVESLEKDEKIEAQPALGTFFVRTNTENKLLKNSNVRKALAYSINRKEIVQHITHGTQVPSTGLVPISMNLQSKPYFEDGNKGQAQELFTRGLEEEKLKKEDFSQIKLIYTPSVRTKRIAETIQQQWFETLGISIQLQPLEQKVYFDSVSNKNYDLACGSWIADFNDAINFLEVFKTKSTGTNNTNWESPNYLRAITDSYYAQNENERVEYLKTAEQIFIDEMPAIPVFNYQMIYMKDSKLKDSLLTKEGHLDFKFAHLE